MDKKIQLKFGEEKIGLALASGGFLGSYELGALNYLKDTGIEVEDFNSIIGTSVGAINMVSILGRGLDVATNMFLNITSKDIYNGKIANVDTDSEIFNKVINYVLNQVYVSPNNIGNLALMVRGLLGGSLDNMPLKELLKREINEACCKEILNKNIDIAMCTLELNTLKQLVVTKEKLKTSNLIDYVMASSSAYPVFPAYKIGFKKYIDGGYLDSNNAKYLFSKFNCNKVVIIDLMNKTKDWAENIKAAYIYPTADLGSFLDTSKEQILKNYNQGYKDIKDYFEKNVIVTK